jgi:hypothetical protein
MRSLFCVAKLTQIETRAIKKRAQKPVLRAFMFLV